MFAESLGFNLRMNGGEKLYIWQSGDWPNWRYDLAALTGSLTEVSHAQGLLLGRMADVKLARRDQASLAALTEDVIKASEIEGEMLNVQSVRSSIARRLGVEIGAMAPVDRHVEGVVEMVLDATLRSAEPLTVERLFGWHAALFPTGYSAGINKIAIGAMMPMDPCRWFLTQWGGARFTFRHHPLIPCRRSGVLFEMGEQPNRRTCTHQGGSRASVVRDTASFRDGNGRIARAVGDLFLARADGSPQRFYSLSAQIRRERKDYYDVLERTQKGTLDVTGWLSWFLGALGRAIASAQSTLDVVLAKARFWQCWAGMPLNERQVKMLNRLLDGFEGKLTSSKWGVMAKCSPGTALRDITQLLEQGVLKKSLGGGRSTSYELAD